MITPFTKEGCIDLSSAEKIITRFVENKVGVFVLGTTGETASIPQNERLKLVECAVSVAGDHIPVYAGIGDNCMSNSVAAAREYLKSGVDAVVSHLPSYYPLGPGEMLEYFQVIHNAINGPIMIYNIPQTTSMSLPLDLVERLSELPHYVGYKDSERDEARLLEASTRLGKHDNFSLFMGSAVLSVLAIKAGFQGLVPGSGNLFPDLWAELYKLSKAKDWDAAQKLQHRLDQIASIFQVNRSLGQSLAALKTLMHDMNLCESYMLPPLLKIGGEEQAALVNKFRSSDLVAWPVA